VTRAIRSVHEKWKNHEGQSPINQTPNDETEKTFISEKTTIKRMSVKIKIKNKLEGTKKLTFKG
jgi:hypothetical protein